MNKEPKHHCTAREETDEEMQAIGYPPPINPAAFAWTLAAIIKRGVQNESIAGNDRGK
jgi:hypothetical protein